MNSSNSSESQVESQVENVIQVDTEKSNLITYCLISALVIGVLYIIYIAYEQFVKKSKSEEKFTKKPQDDEDNPVIDFNLQESISELQTIQAKTVSQLSQETDV